MPTATTPAEKPAAKEEKPKKKPAEKPAASDEKAAAKPAEKKPASGEKKPASGEKKPASGEKKPASGEKKPASDEKKAASGEKPGSSRRPSTGRRISGSSTGRRASGSDKNARRPSAGDAKKAAAKKPDGAKKDAPAPRARAPVVDEPPRPPVVLPKTPVSLPVLNNVEMEVCARLLGNLLDYTVSLGYALANMRPFKSTQHILDQLNKILDTLPESYLKSFLKRFNELGLVKKSKLTKEQKCCVGLDKLTDAQREELAGIYAEYREKFGFPHVVCAREAKSADLPGAVRRHLENDAARELKNGVAELKKIARMRLLEIVAA